MEKLGLNEIRDLFRDFFVSKGHYAAGSASLIPKNDKSLLIINSGMAPLKAYFAGVETPPSKRMTTCQKCIRTGDIDNVGKTARHGTFFEMLGNFSFGDYFKEESLTWGWEFITEHLNMPKDKLWATIYQDDDEAYDIWIKLGMPAERIVRLGKEDNFWEIGLGPCGPCSEIYYDRGEAYGCGAPDCKPGCECDRYIEFWNHVFSQFSKEEGGSYSNLAHPNIDTGMGLERLACIMQDVDSIFDIDTIRKILDSVAQMAGVDYQAGNEQNDVSLRIITDHLRSMVFMIADGIMPSNEGRGYVLRRLLRRAARHGRMLGIEGEFLAKLAQTVIELSKDGYPELEEKKEMILKVLTEEESKFDKTIDQGLAILSEMEEKMARDGVKVMSGEDAFKLYDTYGFPIDLTKEIMEEKGFSIDEEGFVAAMENQRETARKARKTTNYMGADVTVYQSLDPALTTVFTGYDSLKTEGKIMALTTDTEVVEALTDGQEGTIVTDKSPFYATMGGQNADVGVIFTDDAEFVVEDTIKLPGDKIGHIGHVTKGMFTMSDVVEMEVDAKNRENTAKNHSCTHLLHKALREILGNHVEQAGSLVDAHRLRFDFTHFQSLTGEEIRMVEDLVNQEIKAALPVVTEVMDVESAKKSGAMALFGEKYHGDVRVVSMGDFSKELCGGTHVKNTSEIGAFKIISESGIAAGVRRIEALTGDALNDYYRGLEEKLQTLAKQLKTNVSELGDRIDNLLEEVKALKSENDQLKSKLANEAMGNAAENIVDVKGIKLLAMKVEGVEMNELRNLGDQLKKDTDDGVVVLASQVDGKVNLMVMAGESAVKKGAHAGNIVKAVAGFVGGGGGGRPNMAQAGGKKPEGIDEALLAAKTTLDQQL